MEHEHGLVSLHSGGWQKWDMRISVNGVQERHCATFWNYTREYLQGHSNVGRFRDGWNGLSTRLNFVSSSSSLLYVSSSLLFSSLHQYEKEKRKKGYRNIIFMFVYFIKVLKHVTMTNYYNVFVSWLSQSKLQKKKERFFLPLQGFRSKTRDGSRHSEYSCAGQLAVLLSCVSLVAHIGCRIVLVCSSHSGNRTKPTGP